MSPLFVCEMTQMATRGKEDRGGCYVDGRKEGSPIALSLQMGKHERILPHSCSSPLSPTLFTLLHHLIKCFSCPPSAVLDAGLDSRLAECDVSVQITLLILNSRNMLRRSKVRTLISKLSALFVKAGTREVYK